MRNKLKPEDSFNYNNKFTSHRYYNKAKEANKNFNKSIFFREIIKYLKKTDDLCEFGCGDASKLIFLQEYVKKIHGFDLSKEAIKRAKLNISFGEFYVSNSSAVFESKKFDVTISLYSLEHVVNPKLFLKEMIKSTKKGGYIICLCPNFGSPLFPSPPIIHGKKFFNKLFTVIKRVINYRKNYQNKIYTNVRPILNIEWQPDFDTTAEVSLESIVRNYKNKIVYANSFWSFKPYLYIPFVILSYLNVKPFSYWGFNCFFVLKN